MQTVNFTCGHCGKLMAVSREFLGLQVRCPHCQQVVVAPAPEPAAPPAGQLPEPWLGFPPAVEPESIFSPPEEATEDVFASASSPYVEIPSEPLFSPPPPPVTWPNLELPAANEPLDPSAAPPAEMLEPTATYPETIATESAAPAAGFEQSAPEPEVGAPGDWMAPSLGEAPTEAATEGTLLSVVPRVRRRAERGWIIPLLISPLILYSVLATIAVVILFNKMQKLQEQQQRQHPLEMMPDIEGEYKGAKRPSSQRIEVPKIDATLPPHLRTALGQPIQVGDLEITPTKVELRRIWIHTPGRQPIEGHEQALVLHLHFRNLSSEFAFKPLDPSFDRRWKESVTRSTRTPYTYLELVEGGRRFFGGPVPWDSPGSRDRPLPENVLLKEKEGDLKQDSHNRELAPGNEQDTFVCTDYEDQVAQALANYRGQLLWRIHFRRGVVKVGERDVPATAVIGVEFSDKDIRKPG